MGAHSTDFITGGCDVELPAKPLCGRMLIDGDWVEAADCGRVVRKSPAHGVAVSSYPSAKALEDYSGRLSRCTSDRVPDGGCHDDFADSIHLQVAERQLSGRIRAFSVQINGGKHA